jgi:drug/metabolite transporter (DMT)-like permease
MLFASVGTQAAAAALSVAASFVFVLGLALQQKANLDVMEHGPSGSGDAGGGLWASVAAIVTRPVWLLGLVGGGVVGFALVAVALAIGSLTIVEPLQVTQMLFTVPLSAWVVGGAIGRRDWIGAAALVAGLGLMVVVLEPQAGQDTGDPHGWLVVTPVVLAAAAVFTIVALRTAPFAAALYGAAAGALFGLQGALLKNALGIMAGDGGLTGALASWTLWGAGVLTLVAVVLQNLALRAGRLAAAQTTLTTSAPIVSAAIGIIVFGETLDVTSWRVLVAAVGAAVCGWGVVTLARSPALVALHADTEHIGAEHAGAADQLETS